MRFDWARVFKFKWISGAEQAYLRRDVLAGSTRVVIALDGVNHVESSGLALNWLPSSFPSSVRVILSVSANDCGYFSASKSNDGMPSATRFPQANRTFKGQTFTCTH